MADVLTRIFDGFLDKCDKCEKVTDHALIALYQKKKQFGIFDSLDLLGVARACKECDNIKDTSLERVKERALPLVYQKIVNKQE